MSTQRVVFLHHSTGDWQAVYVDGKKVYEGHGIDSADLLGYLNITWRSVYPADDLRENPGIRDMYPDVLPQDLTVYRYFFTPPGEKYEKEVEVGDYKKAFASFAKDNAAATKRDFADWELPGIAKGRTEQARSPRG